MNTIINTVPAHLNTVIIMPEFSKVNIEHIVEILEHGVSDISIEERKTYFDIVEEAQEIGIIVENVSIFKKRVSIKEEENEFTDPSMNNFTKLKLQINSEKDEVIIQNYDMLEPEFQQREQIKEIGTHVERCFRITD